MGRQIMVCFGTIGMGNGVFSIWEGEIPMLISLSQYIAKLRRPKQHLIRGRV
jgi:hypothetical protein